jgi:hypothetical protein
MGQEEVLQSTAAATHEIHVVHGPVVNSYGHLFEAMSGMSSHPQHDQQPAQSC